MLNSFRSYIEKHKLLTVTDKVLLAVSGGADSMVMLYLFQQIDVQIQVAHCNFYLRAEESNTDEQFVRGYCSQNGIKLHVANFDTNQYAKHNKVSIELAARELRYNYFNQICNEFDCNKIAVAHNLNDSAETVILNLSRGTGIKGLTGIRPINENIIRPLLFATRAQIEQFAQQVGLQYRTDSTNIDTKYRRNYVRHVVMPQLRGLNPSVDRAIAQTAVHLQEAMQLVNEQLNQVQKRVVSAQGDCVLLNIDALKKEQYINLFLVEQLSQYNFSPQQAQQVAGLVEVESGRRVESNSHIVYRNREYLVIAPKNNEVDVDVEILEHTAEVQSPIEMNIERFNACDVAIDKSPDVALLDYNKLKYPLILRKWRNGDKFMPFGMKGFKKISDFLVDIKVPMYEKNNVYVLTSEEQIVWVVGFRLDNRFRINSSTKQVVRITKN